MATPQGDTQALSGDQRYRALLAVSEAIVSHRDLSALFHALADRLHDVARFDHFALVLHDSTSNTMQAQFHEGFEPGSPPPTTPFPVESPAGWVWQNQQPLIVPDARDSRWPHFWERANTVGVQSACLLPLATSRCRLGSSIGTMRGAGANEVPRARDATHAA